MIAMKNTGWGHSNIRRTRSHSLGHRRHSSVGKTRQDDVNIDLSRVLNRSRSTFSLSGPSSALTALMKHGVPHAAVRKDARRFARSTDTTDGSGESILESLSAAPNRTISIAPIQENNQNSPEEQQKKEIHVAKKLVEEKKKNDLIAKIKEKYNKSTTKTIQHQNQEKRDESSIPSSSRKKSRNGANKSRVSILRSHKSSFPSSLRSNNNNGANSDRNSTSTRPVPKQKTEQLRSHKNSLHDTNRSLVTITQKTDHIQQLSQQVASELLLPGQGNDLVDISLMRRRSDYGCTVDRYVYSTNTVQEEMQQARDPSPSERFQENIRCERAFPTIVPISQATHARRRRERFEAYSTEISDSAVFNPDLYGNGKFQPAISNAGGADDPSVHSNGGPKTQELKQSSHREETGDCFRSSKPREDRTNCFRTFRPTVDSYLGEPLSDAAIRPTVDSYLGEPLSDVTILRDMPPAVESCGGGELSKISASGSSMSNNNKAGGYKRQSFSRSTSAPLYPPKALMAHRPLRRVPRGNNVYMQERTNTRIYSDIKLQNMTAEESETKFVVNVRAGANTNIHSDTKMYNTTAQKLKPDTEYVVKESASIITTPDEFVQFYSYHKKGYGKLINNDFRILDKDVSGNVDSDCASNDKNSECTDKENIDCIKKEDNESIIKDNDFHDKDENNSDHVEKEDYDSLFDGLSLNSSISSCSLFLSSDLLNNK